MASGPRVGMLEPDFTPCSATAHGRFASGIPSAVQRCLTVVSVVDSSSQLVVLISGMQWPVTGDWRGSGHTGIGVACKDGHGMSWSLMNGPFGGTPQITGGFGNSDSCYPVTGDWDGNGTTTVGVACQSGHGIAWNLSNG